MSQLEGMDMMQNTATTRYPSGFTDCTNLQPLLPFHEWKKVEGFEG
jgi:hypothetical protein